MQSTAQRFIAAFVLALLAASSSGFGWSYKEHILFTRMAVMRLLEDPATPPPMKTWLVEAIGEVPTSAALEQLFLHTRVGTNPVGMTGLSFWAYAPDVHANSDPRNQKLEPFGVHERLLHFVDLELLLSGDARRGYRHDLSGRPKIEDIPRDMSDPRYIQAGMLPFRVEHCYNNLVQAIRENRLHAATQQDQEGKTATYWAGYLAHYLADNTQPHHSTLDYKSQSYFADRRRAPNVHAEMEYRMCDDEHNDHMDLRREYWPLLRRYVAEWNEPVRTPDVWRNSLEVSYRSYDALPLIGLAAMHAGGQKGTPDDPTGPANPNFDTEAFFRFSGNYLGREMTVLEMKAIQTAWAVRRIERFYRQAWDEASAPPGAGAASAPATLPAPE